jgi:hypothetical protein
MIVEDGGEVAQYIKEYSGKTFVCHCDTHFKPNAINSFDGYPHSDGIADAKGQRLAKQYRE